MLPSSRRLSAKEVERVLKEGRPAALGALRLKYLVRKGETTSRFAFVVSKKVAGSAVLRNTLRRWGADAAGSITPPFPVDMALMVGKRYESLDEMKEEYAALLRKVK